MSFFENPRKPVSLGGMTIYKDTRLKVYLEQAGFRDIQIHKMKSWLCVTARK